MSIALFMLHGTLRGLRENEVERADEQKLVKIAEFLRVGGVHEAMFSQGFSVAP